MKNIQKIKAEIEKAGGLAAFSSAEKKERPIGCPMIGMMKEEIRSGLSKEEIHIAFLLGLIGNDGHGGSIIANSKM